MKFDLKKFREDNGYKQKDFAEFVGYKQPILSKMEGGNMLVSDKLLNKIEDVFKINLDGYKKFDRNKRGLYLPEEITGEDDAPNDNPLDAMAHTAASEDLQKRYLQLLEKKSALDDNYFALKEEHRQTTDELALVKENNVLLKELVVGMKELLKRTDHAILNLKQ